jgi:PadR family transcriptional regulator, regulatory protein AphA
MARKAKSPYMILGLLGDGPRSGYDIKVQVEAAAGHFWKESFGSIYPVLARLEGEGLVAVREESAAGRRRRLYGLTPQGRAALRRWLVEPVEPDVLRLELLLKLHVGGGAAPGVMIRHVETYRAQQQSYLAGLSAILRAIKKAEGPEPRGTYRRLTVLLGQRVARARIAWTAEALKMLRRRAR